MRAVGLLRVPQKCHVGDATTSDSCHSECSVSRIYAKRETGSLWKEKPSLRAALSGLAKGDKQHPEGSRVAMSPLVCRVRILTQKKTSLTDCVIYYAGWK